MAAAPARSPTGGAAAPDARGGHRDPGARRAAHGNRAGGDKRADHRNRAGGHNRADHRNRGSRRADRDPVGLPLEVSIRSPARADMSRTFSTSLAGIDPSSLILVDRMEYARSDN
ncbi:hypothetical protein Pme01_35680 [Planosporangium mesophilum]|uniref:Uncharacterized protein n=1 Tax=Planosporangium mesophilum TaxID=689768 RepID=A0A8J3TEE7_9ACTN|nr:hypothetical protein Pme01_35680 [Planosporangium mesophilum]